MGKFRSSKTLVNKLMNLIFICFTFRPLICSKLKQKKAQLLQKIVNAFSPLALLIFKFIVFSLLLPNKFNFFMVRKIKDHETRVLVWIFWHKSVVKPSGRSLLYLVFSSLEYEKLSLSLWPPVLFWIPKKYLISDILKS